MQLQSVPIVDNLCIMVTRFEKSSKLRNGQEYMLLWRVANDLGWRVVEKAIALDAKALARIEKYALANRKKPAVLKWVDSKLAELAK